MKKKKKKAKRKKQKKKKKKKKQKKKNKKKKKISVPLQFRPFPEYPLLQAHVKLPIVLVQVAFV